MASLATLSPSAVDSTQEVQNTQGTTNFSSTPPVDATSTLTDGEDWFDTSQVQQTSTGRGDLRRSTSYARKDSATLVSNGKRSAKLKMPTRQEGAKRQKQSNDKTSKPKPPTPAHDTHVSLSKAYALNAEAKVEYMNKKFQEERRQWNLRQDAEKKQRVTEAEERKRDAEERRWIRMQELEEGRRQWDAKLDADKQQRIAEAEHRERECEERRSIRKHELVLELLRQKKTHDEIKSFLAMFE